MPRVKVCEVSVRVAIVAEIANSAMIIMSAIEWISLCSFGIFRHPLQVWFEETPPVVGGVGVWLVSWGYWIWNGGVAIE